MTTVTHLYDTYREAERAVSRLEAAGIAHENISLVGRHDENVAPLGAPAGDGIGADRSMVGNATAAGTSAADRRVATDGRPMTDVPPAGLARPVRRDAMPADAMPADVMPAGATHAGTVPADAGATDVHSGAGAGASVGTLLGGGVGLLAGIGALAIPGVGPVIAAGWLVATVTGAGAGAAAGGLLGSLSGAGVSERDAHVYAEGVRRGGTLVSVRVADGEVDTVRSLLDDTGAVDITGRRAEYERSGWVAHDPAGDAFDRHAPVDPARDPSRTL